jgi:hypothetical protein
MTIYARTEEGQAKAYSPDSGLPFKLRAILKVVDGRTSLAMFEDSLRAFGDVRGLLESLVIAGLIKPLPELARRVQVPQELAKPGPAEDLASSLQPHNARPWSATRVGFSETTQQPTLTMHSLMGPATMAMPGSHSTDLKELQALASAVRLIEKFVREHLPQDAPQILGNLEQMNSLELLAVSLRGYESMVGHLGPPADQHIEDLRKIVYEHY